MTGSSQDQPELFLTSWHSWTDLLGRLSLHLLTPEPWLVSASRETGVLSLSRSLSTADGSERGFAQRTIWSTGRQRLYLTFELLQRPPETPPPMTATGGGAGEPSSVA